MNIPYFANSIRRGWQTKARNKLMNALANHFFRIGETIKTGELLVTSQNGALKKKIKK